MRPTVRAWPVAALVVSLAALAFAPAAPADNMPLYTVARGPLRMVLDTLSAPIPVTVAALSQAETPLPVEDPTPVPKRKKTRSSRMHGMAGGIVSLSTTADPKMEPWAWIDIDVPTADAKMAPSLLVDLGLSALPGETLSTRDPSTFRALECHLGLAQPLPGDLHFELYAEGVFATRLPGDPKPRNTTARGVSGGVRFRSARGDLALGIGADQRLTGEYRPAMTLRGAYRMWREKDDQGNVKPGGMKASLVGDAILGLDAPSTANSYGRDVVRIGIAIGL